ncbi:MAG TPA: hypothetical protein VJ649_05940, partial [Actinomycetes bacterium]|nr:hypothetical protein [Actinomycetes bacterium]
HARAIDSAEPARLAALDASGSGRPFKLFQARDLAFSLHLESERSSGPWTDAGSAHRVAASVAR